MTTISYLENLKENIEKEIENANLECTSDAVKVVKDDEELNIYDVIKDLEYKIDVINNNIKRNDDLKKEKNEELKNTFNEYLTYFKLQQNEDKSALLSRQMDYRKDNNITQKEIFSFLKEYNIQSGEDITILEDNTINNPDNIIYKKQDFEYSNVDNNKEKKILIKNLLLLNKLDVFDKNNEIDKNKIKDINEKKTLLYKKYIFDPPTEYTMDEYYIKINNTFINSNPEINKEEIKRLTNEIIYEILGYNKARGIKISETHDCQTKSKHKILSEKLKDINDKLYEINEGIGDATVPNTEMYDSNQKIKHNLNMLEAQDFRLYEDYTKHFYKISKENEFIKDSIFDKSELKEHENFSSTDLSNESIEDKYLHKKMIILPYQYKYFNHVSFMIKKEVIIDIVDLKMLLFKLGLVIDLNLYNNFEILIKTIKSHIVKQIKYNKTYTDLETKEYIKNKIKLFLKQVVEINKEIKIDKIEKELNNYFLNKKVSNIKIIYVMEFYFYPRKDINIVLATYEINIPLKKEEPSFHDLYKINESDIYSSLKNYPNEYGLKIQINKILSINKVYKDHILTKDVYNILENEFKLQEGSIFYLMLNRKDFNRNDILVDFSNGLEKYELENNKPSNFYTLYDHNSRPLFSATDLGK